ncbi:MAG: hypothetical protein LBU88_01200, partial [Treponema sp.]|nr:hypothetical protein [Treponema sp.]
MEKINEDDTMNFEDMNKLEELGLFSSSNKNKEEFKKYLINNPDYIFDLDVYGQIERITDYGLQ